jgi:site-specific DNA-methyltransferase (adenine-specific)
MWVYGSGFPKSLNVSKAIDAGAGAKRETKRIKYVENCWMQGMGVTRPCLETARLKGFHELAGDKPVTFEAARWQGWGTALKPAHEPIVVARKPFQGNVAANVLEHGTGALNIDACRVPANDGYEKAWDTPNTNSTANLMFGSLVGSGIKYVDLSAYKPIGGRWPANLIHDGSEEVEGLFPSDGGASAARFFYSAKVSKRDRDEGLDGFRVISAGEAAGGRKEGSAGLETAYAGTRTPRANVHPTVKPTDLMRYLCRLVTPPGGLVLDPFTGSGSTGKGAVLEGFRFLGIELSPEYADIARARIGHAVGHVAPEPVIEVKVPDALRGQLRLFA